MKVKKLLCTLAGASLLMGCNEIQRGGAANDASGAGRASHAYQCTAMEGDVCVPLTFSLLSDPSLFHGKKIVASGYATWGERSLVVYPSLDMACSQTISSGIEIDHGVSIPVNLSEDLASNGVASIMLQGVFKSDENGLSGRYIGHLDDAVIVNTQLPRTLLKVDPRTLRKNQSGEVADIAIELPKASCG
ncbi:hypothetical protein [Pseudoxanthomonas sp. z9]|uniref:hypothetical protein n=1 Tax=Pseudoxanthomonas sp. z9 TaxID=2584942 RepID=UPI0011414A96|nr:hypothetical protein [Pseudoxanthomonas sp. z9]